MLIKQPIRFPLLPGDTALALALSLGAMGIVAFAPLYFSPMLPSWALHVVHGLMALWCLCALVALPFVWLRRPSDIEFKSTGVSLHGGRSNGLKWTWNQLNQATTHIEDMGDGGWDLSLASTRVATTEAPEELASFRAILTTIRAALRKPEPRGPMLPEVMCCSACGAPIVPAPEEQTKCRYCRAVTTLPPDVVHVAALPFTRSRTVDALKSLLAWRSARTINVLLALGIAPIALAWPLSALFYLNVMRLHADFGLLDALVLACGAYGASVLFPTLIYVEVMRRRAVSLVAVSFRARPPEDDQIGHRCYHCGGPLPDHDEGASLVACAYCRAINLVGLGLAHEALTEKHQADELDAVVQERMEELQRWRTRRVVATLQVILTPVFLGDLLMRVIHHGAAFKWL